MSLIAKGNYQVTTLASFQQHNWKNTACFARFKYIHMIAACIHIFSKKHEKTCALFSCNQILWFIFCSDSEAILKLMISHV